MSITSAEEFVRLRNSADLNEQMRATHDTATEEVWLDIIKRYPSMCTWVARNKTVPISILELLINNGDASVRSTVASKRKATPTMLERLAQDSDEGVRYAVACNKSTPTYVLESLSDDSWSSIQEIVKKRLK